MNLIFTTYFNGKIDPQRKIKCVANKFFLIEDWYNSAIRLNLNGIIFHDCLSKEFIEKYTNENIIFIKYKLSTNLSVNDERFICYYNYLKRNDNIKYLFLTDLFDVKFIKNPFNLINDEKFSLYCGGNKNILLDNKVHTKPNMLKVYGKECYRTYPKIHAGTFGGSRDNILIILFSMRIDMLRMNSGGNYNMIIFNKVVYDIVSLDRIMIGKPLASEFKKYEYAGDFCIKHK